MSYGALGLVEVLGSCNAVVVLDQMLKTSDVNSVPGMHQVRRSCNCIF